MNSIVIKQGVKIVRTPEQIAELDALSKMTDDDIDFSDIPPTTEEEFKRMFKANPRTPEQWEQFYKFCPPKHQARLKKMREILGHRISEPPEHLKNLVIW